MMNADIIFKSDDSGQNTPKKRGFAAMTPEKRKAIAAKGGKATHAAGKAVTFNSDTARMAGKIGGRSVSENKDHMAEIGRKGGEASAKSKGYELIVLHERPQRIVQKSL